MTPDQIAGQIRTILAALGGYAAGRGLITNDMLQALLGLVGPLVAAVWSWRAKAAK